MKQTLLFAAFCFGVALKTTGAILVVNNTNSNPGQFYYLQAAIDSADAGDTLYIQPSPYNYGEVNLPKSLTFIGVGFKPIKDFPMIAWIQQVSLGADLGAGAKFIGLKLAINTTCPPNGWTYYSNNVHVINCELTHFGTNYGNSSCYGANYFSAVILENNLIHGINIGFGNNILVQNNFFDGYTNQFQTTVTNVILKNNIFFYLAGGAQLTGTSILAENNIFIRTNPNLQTSVMNNNLTYLTPNDVLPFGTNTGSDNIAAQDPLFVNYDVNANPTWNPAFNYRLQDLSPGNNAATDGSDIGMYGNNITFSETGENPMLPVIRQMNVLNSTVPSEGTLNIHLKATKSKTDH